MQHAMIAVIGAGRVDVRGYEAARQVGQLLAGAGVTLVCGGLGGVMEAAAKGCRQAGGEVIGLLPGADAAAANEWISYAIPTGLGHARNVVVVQAAQVVIAVEGEYGTLSELAIALKIGRPVVALGRWQQIDGVHRAVDAAEAVTMALKLLPEAVKASLPRTKCEES
ncbi:MAG: TIGR00725 family protein [Desulfuromonas sp.]|nr:TIGR00725 family protein [Desulfuromonas sp.]